MVRRRRKPTPLHLVNIGLSMAVLVIFCLTGVQVARQTSAATTNPYGAADYCLLENNQTVIYGWGADPNATSLTRPLVIVNVGGKSATVETNRANFRDAKINEWIDQNRRGDPKPGTYGFRAVFSGLYKGTRNTITGTVVNEGAGSSVVLGINNIYHTDGNGSWPFFANNVIPEACLATAPAPTPPPAQPTQPAPTQPAPSQPAPQQPAAPRPAPSTPQRPAATPRPVSAPAPAATPQPVAPKVTNSADAAVTSGTLAADFRIQSANFTSVMVRYGTVAASLDQFTNFQPTTGGETIVKLTSLKAATKYYYQVVKTDIRGIQTPSQTAQFETLGYTLSLHFVDRSNKGIAGIPASIATQDKGKTSNEQGDLQFSGVSDGKHKVNYTYKDQRYSHEVITNPSVVTPEEASAPQVVTVDSTVNVEAAIAEQPAKAENNNSIAGIIIAVLLGLAAVVMIILAVIRRRNRPPVDDYPYEEPAQPLPEYQPLPPQAAVPAIPRPSDAQHVGESLKDMVMRSMREEAAKRRAEEQDRQNKQQ